MINTYKDNQQRYEAIIDYIKGYDVPEKLKEELLDLIRKFKIMISCMEANLVYELIDKSVKNGNIEILKIELDITAFGRKSTYNRIARDKRDEEYNLD